MKINPFKPNSPVNPGMFVGRLNELSRIENALIQAKAGEPAHFMVTGERGIGKSSLFLYLDYVATGKIEIEKQKVNFLVVHLDLDSATTQFGLIQRIEKHLSYALGQTEPARNFLKSAWEFIQKVRIMDSGIEAGSPAVLNEVLMDEFSLSLVKIVDRISSQEESAMFSAKYDGVLMLIDEADNCSQELQLGSFLKLLLERLQRQGCCKVLVGLAGLPDLRLRLHASHPSSLRIFEELPLGRLSDAEVERVIDMCLAKANKDNIEQTTISNSAKKMLVSLSEGYPHFIQQFGYSSFATDVDNCIDTDDVHKSAFGERGALDLIGDRYYRNNFYNKISQESYRQVLRIMANDLDGWVARTKIQGSFKGKDSILNNAIKALRDRHIILSKEGVKGVYRLQHKGFALWIKLYGGSDQPSSSEPPVVLT